MAKSPGCSAEARYPLQPLETLDTGRRIYVLCGDGCVLYAARSLNGELSDFSVYARTTVEEGRRLLADKRR